MDDACLYLGGPSKAYRDVCIVKVLSTVQTRVGSMIGLSLCRYALFLFSERIYLRPSTSDVQ